MKIEIDLNEILGDEYGTETLQESVRRQVVEKLIATTKEGISKKIDHEIATLIEDQIKGVVVTQMPAIVDDLMNMKYTPVNRYGQVSDETTFRDEMLKSIVAQMDYKPSRYDSEKNVFTRAVDDVVRKHVDTFQSAFNKQIDAQFISEAMAFATKKLSERLGVK